MKLCLSRQNFVLNFFIGVNKAHCLLSTFLYSYKNGERLREVTKQPLNTERDE